MRPAGPKEQTPRHSLRPAGPDPPDPSEVKGSSSQLDSQPARLIGARPPAGSASTSRPPLAIWWPRSPPHRPDQLEGPGSTQALVQMPTLPSLPAWSLPSLQLSFLTVKLKITISPPAGLLPEPGVQLMLNKCQLGSPHLTVFTPCSPQFTPTWSLSPLPVQGA